MIICPLHFHTDPRRLELVTDEMRRRGAPRLRGFIDVRFGAVFLFEGTHRINAAARLGLAPTIIPIRWWRSKQALINARIAAYMRGLRFERWKVTTC